MRKDTPVHRGKEELVREALEYYARERYDAMLAACEHALAVDETYARAHHEKALALIGLGRLEEAVVSLGRAFELARGAPSYYQAWLLAEKAGVLCALGRYPEALGAYQEAVQRSPNDQAIQAELACLPAGVEEWDDVRTQEHGLVVKEDAAQIIRWPHQASSHDHEARTYFRDDHLQIDLLSQYES